MRYFYLWGVEKWQPVFGCAAPKKEKSPNEKSIVQSPQALADYRSAPAGNLGHFSSGDSQCGRRDRWHHRPRAGGDSSPAPPPTRGRGCGRSGIWHNSAPGFQQQRGQRLRDPHLFPTTGVFVGQRLHSAGGRQRLCGAPNERLLTGGRGEQRRMERPPLATRRPHNHPLRFQRGRNPAGDQFQCGQRPEPDPLHLPGGLGTHPQQPVLRRTLPRRALDSRDGDPRRWRPDNFHPGPAKQQSGRADFPLWSLCGTLPARPPIRRSRAGLGGRVAPGPLSGGPVGQGWDRAL